jgi:hypothetical protein
MPSDFSKQLYKNLHSEFLLHFWKQWEDSVTMLSSQDKALSCPLPILVRSLSYIGPTLKQSNTRKQTYLKLFMQPLLYFHLHTQGLCNLNSPGKICNVTMSHIVFQC